MSEALAGSVVCCHKCHAKELSADEARDLLGAAESIVLSVDVFVDEGLRGDAVAYLRRRFSFAAVAGLPSLR